MKRSHRPIPLHLSSSYPSHVVFSTLSSQRSPLGFGYSSLFNRSHRRGWLRSEPSCPDDQPDVPNTAPVTTSVCTFGTPITTSSNAQEASESSDCFDSVAPPASAPIPAQTSQSHPHLPTVHPSHSQAASSAALPYTPPPMLSPVRNSPGLFCRVRSENLSRSQYVPRVSCASTSPAAAQSPLTFSLSAASLAAAEKGLQQQQQQPATSNATDDVGEATAPVQPEPSPDSPAEAAKDEPMIASSPQPPPLPLPPPPPPPPPQAPGAAVPESDVKVVVASSPAPPTPAYPPDLQPRINEGMHYQADLPEYIGPPRREAETEDSVAESSAHGDQLLIDSRAFEQISGEELDAYLKVASSAALPLGGRNKEFALVLLSATGGDLRESLRLLLRPRRLRAFLAARHLRDLSLSDTTAWTPLETQLFYKSIVKVGKDFFRVSNELRRRMRNVQLQPPLNPSLSASAVQQEAAWQPKSTKQCIEFYFFWKKFCPDEYRRLKKRIQQTNADYRIRKRSLDDALPPMPIALGAHANPKSPIMSPRVNFSSAGGLFGFQQYRSPPPPPPPSASASASASTASASARPELSVAAVAGTPAVASSTAATMAISDSDSFLESSSATATRSSSLTASISDSLGVDVEMEMEGMEEEGADDTEFGGSLELSEPGELSSPPVFPDGDDMEEEEGEEEGDGEGDGDGERDEHMSTSSLPVSTGLWHPHVHAHPAIALTHARSSGLESLAAASAVLSPELAPFADKSAPAIGTASATRNVVAVSGSGDLKSAAKIKSEPLQSQMGLGFGGQLQQHSASSAALASTTSGIASIVAPGAMVGDEELVVKKRRGRPSKAAKALAAAKQQKLVAARTPPSESSLPFTCNRCARRFANVKALNAHKKRHKNADANAGLMDGAQAWITKLIEVSFYLHIPFCQHKHYEHF